VRIKADLHFFSLESEILVPVNPARGYNCKQALVSAEASRAGGLLHNDAVVAADGPATEEEIAAAVRAQMAERYRLERLLGHPPQCSLRRIAVAKAIGWVALLRVAGIEGYVVLQSTERRAQSRS
jgi:hypothetical protein